MTEDLIPAPDESRRDPRRLVALRSLELLDLPRQDSFDRLTRLAAELLDAPTAFLSLVDEERDFYLSLWGVDEPLASLREIAGSTFCHYTVATDRPLVIPDTRAHPTWNTVDTVRSMGVAAYVGVPLRVETGEVIGSVCAIHTRPHRWTERDVRVLEYLASAAMTEIALRREVLERRRAEEELNVFRGFSEHSNDAHFLVDQEARILYVNRLACERLGYTEAELTGGMTLMDIDPVVRLDQFQAVVARGAPTRIAPFETMHRRKDGSLLPVELTHTILHFSDGPRVFSAVRDVTAKREAALALENAARQAMAAEERQRTILETAHEGICTVDREGTITYANPRLGEMLEYEHGELAGRSIFAFMDEEGAFEARTRFAAQQLGVPETREVSLLRRGGERFWANLSASALFAADGGFSGVLYMLSDLTLRREAETALRESEMRLSEAQRVGRVGSWELDVESNDLFWSPEMFRLMGIEAHDQPVPLSAFIGVVHPDDRDQLMRDIAGSIYSDEPYEFRFRVVHPDGGVRVLYGRGEMRAGADGGVERFVGIAQDVTEQERTEAALRESESRFRALAEQAPLGIFMCDLRGEVTYVNPYVAELVGHSIDASLGDGWRSIVHPDDLPRLNDTFTAFFNRSTRESIRVELRVVHPERGVRCAVVETVRILTGTGAVEGYVGVLVDVTEQRTAEAALRRSEARFRALIENASDVIAVLDRDGVTQYISSALEQHVGHSASNLLGTNVLDRIHPDDVERVRGALAEVLTAPRHTVRLEYRYAHVSGAWLTVSSVATNLLDDPAVRGIVVNSHDITEITELESQLRQSQKMEAVGQLAGGVAHDFNNMLTAILGFTTLLEMDLPPDSEQHAFLGQIRKAAEHSAGLTRQLLAFSRRQILRPRVVSLNSIVAGMHDMLRRLIGEHIAVSTLLSPTLGEVNVDPGQMEQVILNLAVNARDAMPKGGTLTIRTETVDVAAGAPRPRGAAVMPGRYAVLSVSDTGVGMDPRVCERIFEPFFTTKQVGVGTGLGLSTVYGIVKQSGGYVFVESEPGEGSTFFVYIPYAGRASGDGSGEGGAAQTPTGTETVLLVEDEPAVRSLCSLVLRSAGYTVLEAENGQQALDIAQAEKGNIHLLLTDVVMPGMSGRTLSEELLSRRPGVRVLFISGYTDDSIVHHGVLNPGSTLLQKPFTPHALLCQVREVLQAP